MHLHNLIKGIETEVRKFNDSVEQVFITPILNATGITQKNEPSAAIKTAYCWVSTHKTQAYIEKVVFYSKQFTKKDGPTAPAHYRNKLTITPKKDGSYTITAYVENESNMGPQPIMSLVIQETDNLIELSNKLAKFKDFICEDIHTEKLIFT